MPLLIKNGMINVWLGVTYNLQLIFNLKKKEKQLFKICLDPNEYGNLTLIRIAGGKLWT